MSGITGQKHPALPEPVHHPRIYPIQRYPPEIMQHNVFASGPLDQESLHRLKGRRGNVVGGHARDKLVMVTVRQIP
ncbi:Uncharacterised protein [Mycobacteroides abscessus subsp. massiliense]|nr:Uncharacterised protein [Mycobacteroides abscessus subsp. massiliense]